MRTRIVLELERGTCKHIAYHKFDAPDVQDKGFYRTTVSMNYFFHGVKERNLSKTRQYTIHFIEEMKFWPDGYFFEEVSIIEHDSYWEFLKYIGYDYKKQKWV